MEGLQTFLPLAYYQGRLRRPQVIHILIVLLFLVSGIIIIIIIIFHEWQWACKILSTKRVLRTGYIKHTGSEIVDKNNVDVEMFNYFCDKCLHSNPDTGSLPHHFSEGEPMQLQRVLKVTRWWQFVSLSPPAFSQSVFLPSPFPAAIIFTTNHWLMVIKIPKWGQL